MSRDFEDFIEELHEEARRGGSNAIAELAAFDAHHRLAREVFDLRKARGMTRRQLAAKSGIRQPEIEAGNSNPTLSTIAVVAYALGAELSLAPLKGQRRAPKHRVAGKRRAPVLAAARRTP
jgi:DNA-binding phage protein